LPLYFFDSNDGSTLHRDTVGAQCLEDQAAQKKGLELLCALGHQYVPLTGRDETVEMTVRDSGGWTVVRLTLTLSMASAH
jgi:hypothetical protein